MWLKTFVDEKNIMELKKSFGTKISRQLVVSR